MSSNPVVQTYEEYTDESYDYTGKSDWHAVYTIQLGELVESGVFDWDNDIINWHFAAYNEEQYNRVCDYFIERYRYREISIIPYKEWAQMLKRKLVFELMPKYISLYQRIDEGINPLADSDEYYKNRTIQSAYPETLLSENADYITDGRDEEFERIKEGNAAESAMRFAEIYRGVDELLLDELETMFICMYTANINGL